MIPVPSVEGGAILLTGSVRSEEDYTVLQAILGNPLTNPGLPARINWNVQIENRPSASQKRR